MYVLVLIFTINESKTEFHNTEFMNFQSESDSNVTQLVRSPIKWRCATFKTCTRVCHSRSRHFFLLVQKCVIPVVTTFRYSRAWYSAFLATREKWSLKVELAKIGTSCRNFQVKLQICCLFGSNFKIDAKYANHQSKWSSKHQLSKKSWCQGHTRSLKVKNCEKRSNFNLSQK